MIRAVFLSVGIYVALCGTGLLMVDSVTLTKKVSEADSSLLRQLCTWTDGGRLEFDPPEWMAFTFIGVGGVTVLYAIALPRSS